MSKAWIKEKLPEFVRDMMRDPRYWRSREPAFVQRVTEGFRKLVNG